MAPAINLGGEDRNGRVNTRFILVEWATCRHNLHDNSRSFPTEFVALSV